MGYESEYLTHRTIPYTDMIGAVLAGKVVSVLEEFNSTATPKTFLFDNTNTG